MKKITIGGVAGRHEMPVERYLFGEGELEGKLFDFDYIADGVHEALKGIGTVHFYPTGLTQVTVQVVEYCVRNNMELYVYYYDTGTEDYKRHTVAHAPEMCGFCKRPRGRGWYCSNCGAS